MFELLKDYNLKLWVRGEPRLKRRAPGNAPATEPRTPAGRQHKISSAIITLEDLAQGHRTRDKIRSERERIGRKVLELRSHGVEWKLIASRLGVTVTYAVVAAREVEGRR